jgi:hypothetical protein
MAFVGGDLIEITYNHPTLGSGTLFPKSSEDTTINLGGFRGADDANMVTGAGENIRQLNNSRWSVEATIAIDTASFVVMKGHIEKIEKDSFVFIGKIRTYAGDACCGYIVKNGAWTFRRMLNRNFYRLKERDSLCDCYTCCFYIDIHLK